MPDMFTVAYVVQFHYLTKQIGSYSRIGYNFAVVFHLGLGYFNSH